MKKIKLSKENFFIKIKTHKKNKKKKMNRDLEESNVDEFETAVEIVREFQSLTNISRAMVRIIKKTNFIFKQIKKGDWRIE